MPFRQPGAQPINAGQPLQVPRRGSFETLKQPSLRETHVSPPPDDQVIVYGDVQQSARGHELVRYHAIIR